MLKKSQILPQSKTFYKFSIYLKIFNCATLHKYALDSNIQVTMYILNLGFVLLPNHDMKIIDKLGQSNLTSYLAISILATFGSHVWIRISERRKSRKISTYTKYKSPSTRCSKQKFSIIEQYYRNKIMHS